MKKFIYTGFTSCHGSINGKDFSFHQGNEYELPENDKLVKSLEAQNLLSPVSFLSPDKPITKKIKK